MHTGRECTSWSFWAGTWLGTQTWMTLKFRCNWRGVPSSLFPRQFLKIESEEKESLWERSGSMVIRIETQFLSYPNIFNHHCSLQFSCSVVPNSLRPHGLQHTRPPGPSPTPGVYSNSCPLSQWCHPTISSPVIPFSSHLQSFPAWGFFQISLSASAFCPFYLLMIKSYVLLKICDVFTEL